MTSSIAFDVIARDKASATFSKISHSSKESEGHLKKYGERLLALGGLGLGAGEVISFLKESATEARAAQKASALTTQVIKTTGGAAKVTAGDVEELSKSIESKTAVDHLQVQSSENLLLTFKNIRNEAGKGNKVFAQATKAAVDLGAGLAAASGGQINFRQATTLVGKALNDPIKGLTALRRVGVAFSTSQQAQIKALVDGGDANAAVAMNLIADTRQFNALVKQNKGNIGAVVKTLTKDLNPAQRKTYKLYQEGGHTLLAQKKILKELKSEFGGAAASQATAADKARIAWKNLKEQVGAELLPVIDNLANKVANDVVPAISKFIEQMHDGTGKGGQMADKLKEIVRVGKDVFKFFTGLPGPVKKYGAELLVGVVVMSKVTAGLRAMGAMFTLTSAQIAAGTTRTQLAMMRLKAGMGLLAGAGGMLLLADSAHKTNQSLGFLEKAAGGALVGFSVAGPWGAAIGGTAGALVGLATASHKTGNEIITAAEKTKHWTDALRGLADASSAEARTEALASLGKDLKGLPGSTKAVEALGIKQRDLVNYITNEGGARARVQAVIDRGMKQPFGSVQQRNAALTQLLVDALKGEGQQLAGVVAKNKQNNAEVATLKANIDKLPAKVQTQIDLLKGKATIADVKGLAAQYKLTPPKVQTLIEALHVNATVRDILGVTSLVKAYGKLHPKPKIDADTSPAHRKLSALTLDIQNLLTGDFTALVGGAPAPHARRKHRAMGGPVVAGQEYIVGEKRPELFVPSTNGTIIPKVPATAGAQFTFTGNIYAQDFDAFLRQAQTRARHSSLDGRRRP